jgi:aldose 1-epimerase
VAGRYANRIAGAKFTLGGREYPLVANVGDNHLHGGKKGFDKYVWQAHEVHGDGFAGVQLTHISPDGDQGYPGTLTATVTYTLNHNNELKMEYVARTDKPTPLNLTNHAYWNLAGAGSGDVLGHLMMLNADYYLPTGEGLIPTGEIKSLKGTPMDFTQPKTIGSRIDQVPLGYDHCYVINKREEAEVALAARVVEPASGRVMEVYTSQPGVQFYTANNLSDKFKAGGKPYGKYHGFCLETQHFPDSPNRPYFPSTILRPGETFHQVTIHRFAVEK